MRGRFEEYRRFDRNIPERNRDAKSMYNLLVYKGSIRGREVKRSKSKDYEFLQKYGNNCVFSKNHH